MEKKTPFFLANLLKRRPQKSASSEENGWGNTPNDTIFNGWGSSICSTSSRQISNGWADEPYPPESHFNGWGSGSLTKPISQETNTNGWAYEKPNDEYNGWGSGLGSGKFTTQEASTNGWMMNETLKDGCNGWSSVPKSTTSKDNSNQRLHEQPVGEPVSKKVDIDVELRPLEVESWAPSAPPLPDDGLNEDDMVDNVLNKDLVETSEGKNADALCVVCWEARVEGACVPCGHMASCMTCLHEIESKQGTCPVCRAKIEKVMRIYSISTE